MTQIYRVDCSSSDGVKTDWITLAEASVHMGGCNRPHHLKKESKPEDKRRWNLFMRARDGREYDDEIVVVRNLTNEQLGFGHPDNWFMGGFRAGSFFYTQEVVNDVF